MPARTSSRLHKNTLPVLPAPAPKRRRGGQSGNTNALKHSFYSSHFRRSDLKDLDNCEFSDLDPKGFDVYAIMAHQAKTLRALVSKARSYFFTSPKGLVSFLFFQKRIMYNYPTHLLQSSPAINAGTAEGAPKDDFSGQARDATPGIGAYEWR